MAAVSIRGRPRTVEIAQGDVRYFIELGYSTKDIAELFNVSKRTMDRFRKQHNIRAKDKYSTIDGDLFNILKLYFSYSHSLWN